MSERTTYTTEDEIQFIDRLVKRKDGFLLVMYEATLRDRKVWGEMDRDRVIEHLRERMG